MVQAQDLTELACDIAVNINWLTTYSYSIRHNLHCKSVNISTLTMQTLNVYETVGALFTGCLVLLAKDRQGCQLPTEPLREPTPFVGPGVPIPFTHTHTTFVASSAIGFLHTLTHTVTAFENVCTCRCHPPLLQHIVGSRQATHTIYLPQSGVWTV